MIYSNGQVSETEYAGLEPNFSLDTLKDIKKESSPLCDHFFPLKSFSYHTMICQLFWGRVMMTASACLISTNDL